MAALRWVLGIVPAGVRGSGCEHHVRWDGRTLGAHARVVKQREWSWDGDMRVRVLGSDRRMGHAACVYHGVCLDGRALCAVGSSRRCAGDWTSCRLG